MFKRRRTVYRRAAFKRRAVARLRCKRTNYDGTWQFVTTTTNGFWRYQVFTTANINNFAELATVFDKYKVHAIKQTWRPRFTEVDGSGTLTNPMGYAHVIIDPDSTVVPTGTYTQANVNAFMENGNVKTFPLNRQFSIYFRPKSPMSTPTGTVKVRTPYCPTSGATQIMSGYHMFIQLNNMAAANPNVILDSYTTVYMTLRDFK